MSYSQTFITIAPDCPVDKAEIPLPKKDFVPSHLIQYQLLTQNPYQFNHEDLIFEVFVRQKEIPQHLLDTEGQKIREELFCRRHPCLRASALTKRYGFGAHYNDEGKIALYPVESEDYKAFLDNETVKKIPAMRTKR
jgi:hypothetical protein